MKRVIMSICLAILFPELGHIFVGKKKEGVKYSFFILIAWICFSILFSLGFSTLSYFCVLLAGGYWFTSVTDIDKKISNTYSRLILGPLVLAGVIYIGIVCFLLAALLYHNI